MNPSKKKKKNTEEMSRFEALIRNLFESFIRKTDAEKRSTAFGGDPFRK